MANHLDEHVEAYAGNSIYDFDNQIVLGWYSRRILELVQSDVSVLELGLGHGFSAKVFAGNFKRYSILEGSRSVILNFQKKYPDCNAEIIESSFENFVTSEKYDVIVLGFVLEHVDNPSELIKQFQKFLSPEGRMYIAVPNAESMNRQLGHLAGLLPDLFELSQNDIDLGHRRFYTVESLKEVIQRSGGKVVRMEGVYLKPFTTAQIMSLHIDNQIVDALCQLGIRYPELSCGLLAEVVFS
ncbi:MAG: class I SAM-dependent methyltransferase [Bacteroidia bacterium]|nr:class I SAM-dependent methyltransferase [Bacteroidia bacterium]